MKKKNLQGENAGILFCSASLDSAAPCSSFTGAGETDKLCFFHLFVFSTENQLKFHPQIILKGPKSFESADPILEMKCGLSELMLASWWSA